MFNTLDHRVPPSDANMMSYPDFPSKQIVTVGDVDYAIYEANGDPDNQRPPIILVHGWPELAYCWKNQIGALANAGFRAIAIDLKGFGYSSTPADARHYSAKRLTQDLADLLDALGTARAIFCGHDWGGALVWSMGQWQPDRVAGIIGVCTPLRARAPVEPLKIIEKRFGPKHYIVQFQEEGVCEKLFETDAERFFKIMFRPPVPRRLWAKLVPKVFDIPGRFANRDAPIKGENIVSDEIIAIYANAYRHSGFHGGINLYRNIDQNWRDMEGRDETIAAPSLWIGAENDLFLPPESASDLDALVPDIEKTIIPDIGHWMTWEAPDALNAAMIDWLQRRFA